MKLSILAAMIPLAMPFVANARPAPEVLAKSVQAYLEGNLRDPYSVVTKVTRGPREATVRADAYTNWSGWAVCYTVNAKNAYGGFVGPKPYLFVFDDAGSILGVVKNTDDSLWFASVIDRECKVAAPESAPTEAKTAI